MKKNTIVKWLLVIFWMIVIFKFSNEPAVISSEKSGSVINLLGSLGVNLDSYFGELANFIVRKAGHFTEYCILYMLLYNAIAEKVSFKKCLILSLVLTFLYASSDEFHQTFVQGREGKFTDVLIDTLGGIFGLSMICLFKYIRNKSNKSRETKIS
ncbi:VanZ family protein [Clostridium sp. JNZ J1-5]